VKAPRRRRPRMCVYSNRSCEFVKRI
jgi:hypothetical protein